MAENNVPVTNQSEVEMEEQRLKYLQFVQMAALHALLYASKAYSYAKNNSGLLKPKVEMIEGTLKIIVSPAYDKYHHVPVEVFVDRKMRRFEKFGNRVQPFVKQVSTKTKNLSAEVKTAGLAKTVYAKLEPTAKGLYTKYEPVILMSF
ncbi:putative rubber elongation factor [Helianthus anomalus]